MSKSRRDFERHAAQRRRAEVDRVISERGLRVEPFGTRGATRVVGPGVDVLLRDWSTLTTADLQPVR